MPAFTCYRLHDTLCGQPVADLDDYVDLHGQHPEVYGPTDGDGFTAKLYVNAGNPHQPGWSGFVRSGFSELTDLPYASSIGAVITLELRPERQHFAFAFGTTGRFLLKDEAWERGYGLQSALNLMYPRGGSRTRGRLVAVDSKRRGDDVIRSRRQANRATAFEAFDLDKLRDLVGGATGTPEDRKWGRRVTGADALHFEADHDFSGLGKLCRDIAAIHDRDDYRESFGWIDSIRPVYEPVILERLEEHIIDRLVQGDITDLDLAPPEIIDWSEVVAFQYPHDVRQKVTRPDLRLQDYVRGLWRTEDDPSVVDVQYLRRKRIRAVDADNRERYRWPVWRCLTGEFTVDGATYIIDEGEIFAVTTDFLESLNAGISALPITSDIAWPSATPSTGEAEFNALAAARLQPALIMDERLVTCRSQTTPVEVCDVLTASRRLIHVKRGLSSKLLSHLFAQGFVSARLLQEDKVFREATSVKIAELGGGDPFSFFNVPTVPTSSFEVIFAIVARWRGRSLAAGLPFFSKITLERTAADLMNRGFKVALSQVDVG